MQVTFDPQSQFMKDFVESATRQIPDAEKVNSLLKYFSNPQAMPLDEPTMRQMSFNDWISAFNAFDAGVKSDIGKGINTDLKLEIQSKMKAEQVDSAQSAIRANLDRVESGLQSQKTDLLRYIKSKKFPLSHAFVKDANGNISLITKAPDYQARQVGTTEILIAQNTPLKYISVQMMKNFWFAGRLDLTSALIERFALNAGEYKGDELQALRAFALGYYEALGIQEKRYVLLFLNSLLDVMKSYKEAAIAGNSIDVLSSALKLRQVNDDFARQLANDRLLEY